MSFVDADSEIEPKVEQVEFDGKLKGSFESIQEKMSHVPFYTMRQGDGKLDIVRVESSNIRKKPFLFYIVTLKDAQLTLTYSIIPGSSDRLRRAVVIKNLASILSVIGADFSVDETKFLQYVDSVIDNLINGMSQSYSTLFNKHDALLSEYMELKKLVKELSISNRNLTIQTSQLNDENKMIGEQLKSLQTYSNDALMAMIEDWIEVHNSSIDVGDFAKMYKVPEPRVEQVLDKMVSMGYIELKS